MARTIVVSCSTPYCHWTTKTSYTLRKPFQVGNWINAVEPELNEEISGHHSSSRYDADGNEIYDHGHPNYAILSTQGEVLGSISGHNIFFKVNEYKDEGGNVSAEQKG